MAGVPAYITPLSYIRGSGTQYITTGIHLRSTDVVKSKWQFEGASGNVYGCYTSGSADDNFCLYAGSASANAYIRYNGQLVRGFKAANGTIYNLEHGPDGFFANGDQVTSFNAATFECSAPMYIFMLPNSSSAKVTARCYGLTVYRDGDQLCNFIPARNELTGEVGFYESVGGVFYENAGTGAFTAGPEVNFSVKTLLLKRRRALLGAAKHYEIPPASDGYTWCYYDVNDTQNATKLLNANTGIDSTMIVDGTPVARSNTYLFQTTGIHLVKFKFNNPGAITQYFAGCDRLVECYLSSPITILPYRIFYNCSNLVKVGLNPITSFRGEGGQFNGCASLANLSFPSFISGALGGGGMTSGCTSLDKVEFPVVEELTSGSTAIAICRRSIIGPNCIQIDGRVWQGNTTMQSFVCRATIPPTLSANAISGTSSSLAIYVPDASVDAYKAASNWSNFASQIRPLSEYIDN